MANRLVTNFREDESSGRWITDLRSASLTAEELRSAAAELLSYADQAEAEESHTDDAIDWLLAVRKYGIARANEMFPPETEQ